MIQFCQTQGAITVAIDGTVEFVELLATVPHVHPHQQRLELTSIDLTTAISVNLLEHSLEKFSLLQSSSCSPLDDPIPEILDQKCSFLRLFQHLSCNERRGSNVRRGREEGRMDLTDDIHFQSCNRCQERSSLDGLGQERDQDDERDRPTREIVTEMTLHRPSEIDSHHQLVRFARIVKVLGDVDEVTDPEGQIDAVQHDADLHGSEVESGAVEGVDVTEVFIKFEVRGWRARSFRSQVDAELPLVGLLLLKLSGDLTNGE
jgi:hypothetical protein